MKQNQTAKEASGTCKTVACLKCALCAAINFEERRNAKADVQPDGKALYGAEALGYAYHFSLWPARG